MTFLTDFADQAVVLPVALAVLLGLLILGWGRGALAWAGCIAGVLAAVLAFKLVGVACGGALGWGSLGLVSVSGHTASACVVYGGLAAVLAPRSRVGGLAALAAIGAVGVVVGGTRLELRMHTPVEVAIGALVGLAGALLFRRLAGPVPARAARPRLLAVAGAVMLVCHGHRLNAEARLRWLSAKVWPLTICQARVGGLSHDPMQAAKPFSPATGREGF